MFKKQSKLPKSNPKKTKEKLVRAGLLWVSLLFAGFVLFALWQGRGALKSVPISDVINRANKGEIEKLEIQDNTVTVTKKGESKPSELSQKEAGSSIYEQGLKKDAPVQVQIHKPSEAGSLISTLVVMVIPTLIVIAFLMFMMRQAQGQNNQAMGFGKSRARLYGLDGKKVKFTDIAGNENAKKDLEEVVDFLKNPKKYSRLGAKIPTGLLIGVGASRVRDLFSKAQKNAPAIIFIDEIDAVGRKRGSGMGGGHDEREQTLNQILVEMDGFENDTNVIVIAATNRADVLDPALLRPGRFDRRVKIELPERADRLAILQTHFKNKPTDKTVDLDALAAKTAGSSGADLANIANESAIIAAGLHHKEITNDDLTEAFEIVAIGHERKTKVMNEAERRLTAVHEAGHAVVGHVLPNSDPVHKVTIIPRGGTGGVTWFIPPEDRSYRNIYDFKDILARAMGGRQAERLVNGEDAITTGAGMDLKTATDIARDMVTEQGMGRELRDQVFHDDDGGMIFDKITHARPYSEKTAQKIDAEVEALVKEAVMRARVILEKNRASLDALAEALLEKETIEADEVAEILKNAKLPKEAKLY